MSKEQFSYGESMISFYPWSWIRYPTMNVACPDSIGVLHVIVDYRHVDDPHQFQIQDQRFYVSFM